MDQNWCKHINMFRQ